MVDGARRQALSDDDHRKLRAAVETLGQMARMLADKDATLRQLRQMLLKPATTEKTRAVLERAGIPAHGGKAAQPPAGNAGNGIGTDAIIKWDPQWTEPFAGDQIPREKCSELYHELYHARDITSGA